MKIIALQGRGGSGKTTTITKLPNILISNGYKQVPNKKKSYGGDFLDIFDDGNKKVGITSSGDTYDLVNDRLSDLVKEKCDVCICACRTADRKPHGTIAATKNFPSYTNEYVVKTYATGSNNQLTANQKDAQALFNRI
ncbi:hypothetical protein FHG64_06310 [Antarcticibacterium flavum]|uniref:ATP-binding protein n=1 Tax=Antarcticibacterium flavum TaxID=2058175 RepID=A0A5B7X168_9FLAO|nr:MULTISPECIES: hypothetical protein [Antarcticibacterium]MCM4161892.1 hypothetical protein [Antarcticibacterium sp. W02-3]QCY69049.1 hypothetical protein FHG64_06310 [Antarcticibacterium flavum]